MNFLTNTYYSLQYYFKANKEMFLYNYNNNAYLRSNVIYSEQLASTKANNKAKDTTGAPALTKKGEIIIPMATALSEKKIMHRDVMQIDYATHSKNGKSLIAEEKLLTNRAYAIIYDGNKGEVIQIYKDFLYNANYMTFLIERPIFEFMFRYEPFKPQAQRVSHYKITLTNFNYSFFPIALVAGILCYITTYYACKRIIKKLAKVEPSFDDFMLKNTKTVTYAEIKNKTEDHCIICYEEYEDDTMVRALSCEHYFHTNCIDRWLLSRQHYCPCCRKAVSISNKY